MGFQIQQDQQILALWFELVLNYMDESYNRMVILSIKEKVWTLHIIKNNI